jgi:hypothetical protein
VSKLRSASAQIVDDGHGLLKLAELLRCMRADQGVEHQSLGLPPLEKTAHTFTGDPATARSTGDC